MKTTTHSINKRRISSKGQRGVTLFFGMLFLLTIVLLTLGGVAMSRYQQRLALAMNDREVAFQKASQALRAAELSLYSKLADGKTNNTSRTSLETLSISGWDDCKSTTVVTPSENRCRYDSPPESNPYADTGFDWKKIAQAPFQNIEKNPDSTGLRNYLIEAIPEPVMPNNFGLSTSYIFRITAAARGRFDIDQSQVRLQEIYRIDQIDNSGQ